LLSRDRRAVIGDQWLAVWETVETVLTSARPDNTHMNVGVNERASKTDFSTAGLQSFSSGRIVWCIGMKPNGNGERHRVELGRHIVADAEICGGQPTFKGTRIMVWLVLEQLEDGMTWDEVVDEWGGKVPKRAIAEAVAISDLVVKHEPFKGFNVGARRKPPRRATALAA
jgi:uncharacterized protein (DUF433 family)